MVLCSNQKLTSYSIGGLFPSLAVQVGSTPMLKRGFGRTKFWTHNCASQSEPRRSPSHLEGKLSRRFVPRHIQMLIVCSRLPWIVNNWAITMSVRGRVNGETWPGSNRPTALVVDSFQQALSVLGTCWDRVDLRCCESRTAMQLRRMGLIEVTDGRPRIRLTEWT